MTNHFVDYIVWLPKIKNYNAVNLLDKWNIFKTLVIVECLQIFILKKKTCFRTTNSSTVLQNFLLKKLVILIITISLLFINLNT